MQHEYHDFLFFFFPFSLEIIRISWRVFCILKNYNSYTQCELSMKERKSKQWCAVIPRQEFMCVLMSFALSCFWDDV